MQWRGLLKGAYIFAEHAHWYILATLIQDSCSIKVTFVYIWVDKNGRLPIRQTPNFSHTPKTKTFPQQEIIAYRLSRLNARSLPLWKANNLCTQTVLFNIYFLPAKANRHNALNDTYTPHTYPCLQLYGIQQTRYVFTMFNQSKHRRRNKLHKSRA